MFFSLKKVRGIQRGFSLIEMLVSLSVFAIIMVASTSTLLTLIDVNAKAQALYTATNNLSFALDSITREIRMGYHYYCFNSSSDEGVLPEQSSIVNHDCEESNNNAIAFFRERDDTHIGYRLTTVGSVGVIQQKINSGSWMNITSADEIMITKFELNAKNTAPYCSDSACGTGDDENQPTVVLRVAGYVNNGLDTTTDFNIQTKIIQRRLDLF